MMLQPDAVLLSPTGHEVWVWNGNLFSHKPDDDVEGEAYLLTAGRVEKLLQAGEDDSSDDWLPDDDA